MHSFKRAAKLVGSNRVHPTESQDADTEMAEPPRRRRQSFSHDVRDSTTSQMAITSQKTGNIKLSPDIASARRPSIDAKSPLSARSASPAFRRRSLSNGSVGAEVRSLMEQAEVQTSAKAMPVQNNLHSLNKNAASKFVDYRREHDAKGDVDTVVARASTDHVQSAALQRFFSSAEKSNSWSSASKKMIFGSDLDDAKLQNRAKLEAR